MKVGFLQCNPFRNIAMKVIRYNVFETNSSSTHSLTLVDEEKYGQWKDGKLLFNSWNDEFVPADSNSDDEDDIYTYARYFDENEFETFEEKHVTPKGDTVVAFGYYGYDG
jgi:hypothetical protein